MPSPDRMKIAVVGSGVSGLSAAWLLHRRHDVTVYEKNRRVGGHSNTVSVTIGGAEVPVDTGFIVYNPVTYPNFVELLRVLGVESNETDMSFSASLEGAASNIPGRGSRGFSASGPISSGRGSGACSRTSSASIAAATRDARSAMSEGTTLGDYLTAGRYGAAFRDHHILPMASAIWSAVPDEILGYPAAAFLRFHDNHGLLQLARRPIWRTVSGSREYVARLAEPLVGRFRFGAGAARIERIGGRVAVTDGSGERDVFDQVVLATHADEALALLADPSARERSLLGAFRYSRNEAWLHGDESFMPRRRAAWASWNYVSEAEAPDRARVTYWMNALQRLPTRRNLFVTLNPQRPPRGALRVDLYDHPIFDGPAIRAQKDLWTLQGAGGVWFCGAHFGAGFHEDGLQAGLAVAEQLGGVRRPWRVENESARIAVAPAPPLLVRAEAV